jgi:hypothetical protein
MMCLTNTKLLMVFWQRTAVHLDNLTKYMSTECGQTVEYFKG